MVYTYDGNSFSFWSSPLFTSSFEAKDRNMTWLLRVTLEGAYGKV
jgi:hypothetical protein